MFPPAVRPQPGFRLCYNILFQAAGMQLCYFIVLCGSGVCYQQLCADLIIASFYPFYVGIYYRVIQLPGDSFGTQEHGGTLVEEVHPVGIGGIGSLVGYKSRTVKFGPFGNHGLKCVLHGNKAGAEACTHAVHEPVEVLVGQWMIDHIQLQRDFHAEAVARPFPIALMPHHQDDTFMLLCKVCQELFGLRAEGAMPEHAFPADGQCLKGFQEKVAQVFVKPFADELDLCFGFAGEGIAQVLFYKTFTVANYMVQQHIKET